jgi:hypothetical protein
LNGVANSDFGNAFEVAPWQVEKPRKLAGSTHKNYKSESSYAGGMYQQCLSNMTIRKQFNPVQAVPR